jgi:hypothetical protein
MHMRGKAMSIEAIYPDGRREVLSMVSNFQWRWRQLHLRRRGRAGAAQGAVRVHRMARQHAGN